MQHTDSTPAVEPVSSQASKSELTAAAGRSLSQWFDRSLGRHVIDLERQHLARVLPNLFGYHVVQIGHAGAGDLLDSSCIQHKVFVHLDEGAAHEAGTTLICSAESLPLAADSLDVLVLPHVLEFSPNPHRVLREAERVLIGEGHLVLIGFNPWSLWGLWRLFLCWRDEPPWCGHFYGLSRIRDWLSLLDLELVRTERFSYRPPLRNVGQMGRLEHLERLGRHLWPWLGGVYLLVAKKRVIPLTALRVRWRARRSMIAAGMAEPSTREPASTA
ncbi:MAG: class I SAM-dependent methyltransferase [Gammaproteobacteria bacterium]